MIRKQALAVISGTAIALAVCVAATLPRWHPAATVNHPAADTTAPASTAAPTPSSSLALVPKLSNSPRSSWASLSPAQHEALAPLATEWDRFNEARKQRWLRIAANYPKMTPEAKKRLQQQMQQWATMTPEQRKVARENYQLSKSVPLQKREQAWQAYQKLPEDQKKKLAAAERTNRKPLVVSAPPTGTSEIKDLKRSIHIRPPAKNQPASQAVPGHAPHAAAGASAAAAMAKPAVQGPASGTAGASTAVPMPSPRQPISDSQSLYRAQ